VSQAIDVPVDRRRPRDPEAAVDAADVRMARVTPLSMTATRTPRPVLSARYIFFRSPTRLRAGRRFGASTIARIAFIGAEVEKARAPWRTWRPVQPDQAVGGSSSTRRSCRKRHAVRDHERRPPAHERSSSSATF